MTIKDLVRDILETYPECRNDYKKLIWKVWDQLGFVNQYDNSISFESFMKAPQPESIRRPAQNEFRSDRLLGENKIQPARLIKEIRQKLADEKGASFIIGKDEVKEEWVFNPETGEYRHEM